MQWTDKKTWQTRNINNKNDPQKKHRLGTVNKNYFYWRAKLVSVKVLLTVPSRCFSCGSFLVFMYPLRLYYTVLSVPCLLRKVWHLDSVVCNASLCICHVPIWCLMWGVVLAWLYWFPFFASSLLIVQSNNALLKAWLNFYHTFTFMKKIFVGILDMKFCICSSLRYGWCIYHTCWKNKYLIALFVF